MVLRELFVKLGLQEDSASFAAGFATVEGLRGALDALVEIANRAREFLGEQIRQTVEAGVEADRFAQRMGLSAKEVQQFAYVGKTAGVTLSDMQVAMRTLAERGVGDLKGTLFSLADQFSHMKDGGYKLGLATEYLGRAGSRLIPILNKGSGAIKELMQEAEDLGFVIGPGGIQKAVKEYDEANVRLSSALIGLRNVAVVPLLPYLSKLASMATKLVIAFAKWLKTTEGLKTHILVFIGVLALFALGIFGVGAAVEALAVAIWTVVIPFVAWAAAIAAVYLAIDDLVVFFENGDSLIGRALKKWVGPFDTWQEGLNKVWAKVKAGFSEAMDWLATQAGPLAAKIGAAIEDNLRENNPGLASILDFIHDSVGGIKYGLGQSTSFFNKFNQADEGGDVAGSAAFWAGGAHSPAVAASKKGGMTAVHVVNVAKIEVHSSAANPEHVAHATVKAIHEENAKQHRAAAQAAGN